MSIDTTHEVIVEQPIVVQAAPQVGIPELMAMFQQMTDANREGMIEAIREMKRPSEEEQAKKDGERARSMLNTQMRVQHARNEEQEIAARQRNCAHLRKDGKTAMRGQANSNGYSQAFCPHCHYLSPPFALQPHEIAGGLNMGDWRGNVQALVESRAKNSPPPPPIPRAPYGATIIFGEA